MKNKQKSLKLFDEDPNNEPKKDQKKINKNLVDLGKRGRYHLKNKLNELTGKEWVKSTKSWFLINPKQRKSDTVLHPAKYPEELVREFVMYFTKENEIVFDPFLGTGSTLVSSKEINRRGIGIELNNKYADISKERLNKCNAEGHHVICGDSTKISTDLSEEIKNVFQKLNTNEVDFIINSPPYWDMLNKSRGNIISAKKQHDSKGRDVKYSDNISDLGNIEDYENYMQLLIKVYSESYKLLKDKGYLVIVIQNIRVKEGHMVPLAWDLGLRLSEIYELKQERLWLQDNKRLNCWGYPSTYVSNVHHHYCLVFQKTQK